MDKKKIISPTQISLYQKCGEAYRRRYLKNEIIPPKIAQIKGTSIHKSAEHNFRNKIDSYADLKKTELQDIAVSTLEETIKHEGIYLTREEEDKGKLIVIGEAKDVVARLAETFHGEVAPLYQPIAVEDEQVIELPSSTHDLKGILDMEDNKNNIVDLKTSSKSWSQDRADKNDQFTFYSMLKRAKTGRNPNSIIVENLVEQKKGIKRNKLTTSRDMVDYQILINRINSVLEGINKNVFLPAPRDSWYCNSQWCGYSSTCPYYKEKEMKK